MFLIIKKPIQRVQIFACCALLLVFCCFCLYPYNKSDQVETEKALKKKQASYVRSKPPREEFISSREQEDIRAYFQKLDFDKVCEVARPWTMVGKRSLQYIYDYVLHVNELGIEGDIVELGVWKGGATMVMMLAQLKSEHIREFWLFDTFQGLPPPTKDDDERSRKIYKQVLSGTAYGRQRSGLVSEGKWNYGPKSIVKNVLRSTGFDMSRVHLIEGKVEETLRNVTLPSKIAILRLDTDWYASTKIELEVLWDLLVPGGLLYIDDYCSWGGARKATNEFFTKRGLLNLLEKSKKQNFCLSVVKP